VEVSVIHSNTERLIDYWRARKDGPLSPGRSSIEPTDFADLLPQSFILGRAVPGQYLFRLAGGQLARLHQRDLRRTDFLQLWRHADRPRLGAAMEAARRAGEPLIVTAQAVADTRHSARIEILMAPLRAEAEPQDRFLGLYQPLDPINLLRDRTSVEFGLIGFDAVADAPPRPVIRLAAVDGRAIS